MQPTVYQKPEIRDANDNIIQQGAFGKNTALANSTNDGWIDYVANDLEFLYDLAKDEVVPVPALPASGQTNKTYLLTTTGVSYRWSGTEWVAVSSSEAVGRAESAALLAEQWATKTDGTVDGTEYSAKYYAEQAEVSADDAQDTADDMATHLVQIDKNTGGVSKNSKRISNIEKLLQGNLYDYDTDDDVAYTKTVPSGALPYAGIEQIGGKTIVYNQLLQDGNFALGDTTHWKQQGSTSTIAFSNGVATVTLAGTPSAYNPAIMPQTASRPTSVVGHKYLLKFEIMADYVIGKAYVSSAAFSPIDVGTDIPANVWTTLSAIVTATSAGALVTYIGTLDRTGAVDGSKLNFRNIFMIDLTLMFGSGNEPSTVAEFEAMFPADYYSYNAGTLLSAGVTGVESKSKNLVDQDDVFSIVSGATKVEDYWKVSTSALSSKYPSNIDTSPSPKFTQQTLTMSFDVRLDPSELTTSAIYYGFAGNVNSINIPTTWTRLSKTITNNTVAVIRFSYSSGRVVNIRNFQIEANATATEYEPYAFPSFSIPTAIQQLEGYGWSAGNVYNYVDFERKVFVQNVGKVTVTSADVPAADSDYIGTSTISGTDYVWIRNFKYSLGGSFADRRVGGYSGVAKTGTVVINNTSFMASQYRTFFTVANRDALLTAIGDGMDLYYELATPIETDISQYLTDDNLIEVGAGGTLTFPNSNGNDYHIPVPSTETYMIDLQEAISNG